MEKEIKLPQISEGEDSGLVSDVYVKKGDKVEAEQSIIAVESDKATVDVPVEEGGKVLSVNVKEGDEIKVGDSILVLDVNGNGQKKNEEENEEPDKDKEKTKDKSASKKENKQTGETREVASEEKARKAEDEKEPKKTEKEDGNVPAAPLARKFARELGIDIKQLDSGDPEQRITRDDVFRYAREVIKEKGTKQDQYSIPGIELPDFSKWGETERQPMSGVRRITAKNTTRSWQNIPHVTHIDEADITRLEEFRRNKNEKSDDKLTVTSILLKVAGEALQTFPRFNASLDMARQEIVFKDYVHIGVAVDTDDGLLVPVIRDVDKKSIMDLSIELRDTAKKARERKLSSDDMKGGNFVLSNLGGIGGTAFTPVIFPPQVAILGVSRAAIKPIYKDDDFAPRTILPLSLSYDHRLIDGADAARFLRWICESIEEPWNVWLGK